MCGAAHERRRDICIDWDIVILFQQLNSKMLIQHPFNLLELQRIGDYASALL